MKSMKIVALISALLAMSACTQKSEKSELTTPDEKISYALGLDIGNNLKSLGSDIDVDILIQSIRDTLQANKSLMSQTEVTQALQEFSSRMQAKQSGHTPEEASQNQAAGDKFLSENKTKPGVTATESGLQYKVITEGSGRKPAATDQVTVHYRGTLIDGTEFDSSYGRGKPTTFALNQVIPGWTEGLQLMNVGSKYEFYIPANLAYGSRGAGKTIGPNSTLIFQVELLKIAN